MMRRAIAPLSSRRQTGSELPARTSSRPARISLSTTLRAASPLRFAGSSTPRSARCEAADRMMSCVGDPHGPSRVPRPHGYRHGLRASELCDLQWSQVELATGRLHVRRAKNGSPTVHPMQGEEIRARCGVCSANRGRPRTSL